VTSKVALVVAGSFSMSMIRICLRPLSSPFLVLFALGCLVSTGAAQTQPRFENLDRIDGLVATTVGAGIGQPGGAAAPVDRRLKLAPCPNLPQVDTPTIGAATVSCPALGWRLRVALIPGGELSSQISAVSPRRVIASAPTPPVIRKGDPVQLVAGDASFMVSRPMVADEDGAPGASIRVREGPRAAPVTARVESAGVVRIPGV